MTYTIIRHGSADYILRDPYGVHLAIVFDQPGMDAARKAFHAAGWKF